MSQSSDTPWAILMACCQNAEVAIIAAPYIKAGAIEPLLDAISPSASITCVSRWTPHDVRSGATDLACRTLVEDRKGTFLLHDRLHAKYYRFDNQVLLGSANLTKAGTSIEKPGNLEILCCAPPAFEAEEFERRLLQEAYPVNDTDFALWNQIAPIQLPNEQLVAPVLGPDGLENWKPITRRPEYLWLAYQQRTSEIPLPEQQEFARWETSFLGIPSGLTELAFNNWIKLSLLTSPFIKSVLATTNQPMEATWDQLSRQWNITKAEAERSRSTAQNWIAYFGMSSP